MTRRALLLAACTFSILAPCLCKSFLRAGQVTEADASNALTFELTSADLTSRLAKLERKLHLTYIALPKNGFGNLGHQAVRYVLHRFFVSERGWFIRGLEPNNNTWSTTSGRPPSVNEWVPNFLQALLEKRLGEKGCNLHDLAALAAAVEDLVRVEAKGRLQTAYEVQGLSQKGHLSERKAESAINTYFMAFLLAGNFSAGDATEIERKKGIFAKKYVGYKEAKAWLDNVVNGTLSPEREKSLDFVAVTDVAASIGERYYTFNDLECKSLKKTLRGLEGKKAGRVRLSSFYKAGLYSHWRFNEKQEYLRSLGALDESEPSAPRVIVPNYVMARTNCLEASKLYAICCRNECEDLMGHLEREIGEDGAWPKRIAELVAALPSESVLAPRNLSTRLVGRLEEVARRNGGKVPIHGRLFAQWMHHAYPHECPYPHEAGKTNPQTPDEWMEKTGNSESAASTAEMLERVESDTCASDAPQAGNGCGDEEDEDLQWSGAEELLIQDDPAPAPAAPGLGLGLLALLLLVAFGVAEYLRLLRRGAKEKPVKLASAWPAAALAALVLGAWLLNLLDWRLVLAAALLGLAALALRHLQAAPKAKAKLLP